MTAEAIVQGRRIVFRLDHPKVQRRGRIGGIRVFTDDGPIIIRVYGPVGDMLHTETFQRFQVELRQVVDKAFVEALTGKPTKTFIYKRFNPSLALTDTGAHA